MRTFKLTFAFLAAIGVILLAGCSENKGGGEVKSESTPPGAAVTAPGTMAPAGGGAPPAGEKQVSKPSSQ